MPNETRFYLLVFDKSFDLTINNMNTGEDDYRCKWNVKENRSEKK